VGDLPLGGASGTLANRSGLAGALQRTWGAGGRSARAWKWWRGRSDAAILVT